MKKLKLTDDAWSYGSYPRKDYKKDMLYTFYQYRDFLAVYNYGMGRFDLKDGLADRLYAQGLISGEEREEYDRQVRQFVCQPASYDDWPVEKIYGQIQRIRRQRLGAEALEKGRSRQMQEGCVFTLQGGIDQRQKKQKLLDTCEAVLMALCEPELFFLMKQDVEKAVERGVPVYVLVSPDRGCLLPTAQELKDCLLPAMKGHSACSDIDSAIRFLNDEDENLGLNLSGISPDETLQICVDRGTAVLLVYGEDGFLHCRNLRIDSVVHGIPSGYFTRALTNQMEADRPCVTYVPKHFDITRWVGLTQKTRLSYWQLARLWEVYGDRIYTMSVKQLYRQYPQYFLNIYESGDICPEAAEGYPIQLCLPDQAEREGFFGQYDALRDRAIGEYLNRLDGFEYLSAYFDENLRQKEIPWASSKQQRGILVQGIRAARAEKSCVIRCDGTGSLRQQAAQMPPAPIRIFSNFLFFLTPKLAAFYNGLREDRPREQLDFDRGHLDYMLYQKDGKRVETFPLYRKACVAMKEDGHFLFFRYRLGGGSLSVSGCPVTWTAADVDIPETGDLLNSDGKHTSNGGSDRRVKLYTPYFSGADQGCDARKYRRLVGEGRINLVIIQDRILCIRRGAVVLPAIGVVVSLNSAAGEDFLQKIGRRQLEDDYYDCADLELCLTLDGPEEIPKEQWQQVKWAYGGGLSLILNGESLWEDSGSEEMLEEEGWMTPLSCQTQETEIQKPARHPRTAVGLTRNGDLFVLVFSGRTLLSVGADYGEMCRIARQLFPDAWCMMNMDGGGSSVLGLAVDGHFMELSYPATSAGSCAGMARRISTALCLEQ